MAKNRTLLVTGASGRLGRRVVELLADSRADRIVATTRNPDKLATWESASRIERAPQREKKPAAADTPSVPKQ